MVIFVTEQTASGLVLILTTEGSAFFIRPDYLTTISPLSIKPDAEFTEEQEEEIIDAGFATSAEAKAVDYLSRAEQCRFKLTQKLIEKGFEKKHIDMALDYLESKNYLNDRRYTESFLHLRKINHLEGRIKLTKELQNRGINREIIKDCLDQFFLENNEEELCIKAMKKMQKKGKSGEKLENALFNAGFPYNMIRRLVED